MLNSLRRHSVFLFFFSWMENFVFLGAKKNLNDKVTSKMKKRLYLKERNKRYKNTRASVCGGRLRRTMELCTTGHVTLASDIQLECVMNC